MSVTWRAPVLSGTYGVTASAVSLVTAPVLEPIDIAETKLHLRETQDDEWSVIERLIVSERRHCEAVTDLKLITQTWDITYDEFPSASTYRLWLPIAPIQLTPTAPVVTYVDEDGVTQTWSSALYRVVVPTLPPFVRRLGYIEPVFDGEYPDDVRSFGRSVNVRVVAGFGLTGASVPEDLITDMLANIATRFTEGRQSVITGTFISAVPGVGLYSSYRPAV